jgi:hypothetical protein
MIRKYTRRLKEVLYKALQPFGLSYVISYILKYPSKHAISNFCGNILDINNEYLQAGKDRKNELTSQFERIIDALVLPNGVRKTTYSGRHNAALSSVCTNKAHYLNKDPIKILDIPSSVGLSSIDNYGRLSQYYKISSYTMADQFFEVIFDTKRGCIFDDTGNLLQVRLRKQFFSIYRPHTSGNAFGFIAKLALFPLDIISHRFRSKYKFEDCSTTTRLLLLHPEADTMVKAGAMHFEKSNIFEKINGRYDIILSFNLLQKNYFPEDRIRTGKNNLIDALSDGGLLIMGSTESYSVTKKEKNQLIRLESVGDF